MGLLQLDVLDLERWRGEGGGNWRGVGEEEEGAGVREVVWGEEEGRGGERSTAHRGEQSEAPSLLASLLQWTCLDPSEDKFQS